MSLLLVVPSLWALVEADTSDLNRRLRDFPQWHLAKHLQPSFHVEVGEALADRLGARRLARRASGRLSWWLGDSPTGSLIAGRSGWLFFRESMSLMTRVESKPIKRRRAVQALQAQVVASGRSFRMVVAPNKATLYPDKLQRADRRRWGLLAEPKIERFRRIMSDRPVQGFLDVGEVLREKASSSSAPLYEPLGSHWVDEGAVEAARLLVQSLKPGLWEQAAVSLHEQETIASDLLPLAGLGGEATFPSVKIEMPWFHNEETYKEWTEPGLVRIFSSTKRDQSVASEEGLELLPPVVLIHDSFGSRLGMLLAPFFKRIAMLNYAAAWSPTAQRVVSESQIVIFEMAERYFFLTSGTTPSADWEAVRVALEKAGPIPSDGPIPSGGPDGPKGLDTGEGP